MSTIKTITISTIQNFCRTCLCEVSGATTADTHFLEDENLYKCFRLTTNTTAALDDCYSKQLCEVCREKMRMLYEFRELAFCCMVAAREMLEEESMPPATIKNLQKYCRTCLKVLQFVNSNELMHINNLEVRRSLGRLKELDQCLSLPHLPQTLCENCYKMLCELDAFRQVAFNSLDKVKKICTLDKVREDNQSKKPKSQKQSAINDDGARSATSPMQKKTTIDAEKPSILSVEQLPISEEITSLICAAQEKKEDDINKDKHSSSEKNIIYEHSEAQEKNNLDIDNITAKSNENNTEEVIRPKRRSLMSYLYGYNDSKDKNTTSKMGCAEAQQSSSIKDENKEVSLKKQNSSKKSIKCSECNKTFLMPRMLKAHVRRDHKGLERPFQCAQCPRAYRMYHFLQKHIKEVHAKNSSSEIFNGELEDEIPATEIIKVQSSNFPCHICEKVYKRKTHLTDHMRLVHELVRSFKCSYCDELFYTRNSCDMHELTHSDQCEECGQSYSMANSSCTQDKHQTTNLELLIDNVNREQLKKDKDKLQLTVLAPIEKSKQSRKSARQHAESFSCSQCMERFGRRQTWRRHEDAHETVDVSKSVCNICNCGFKQAAALSKHMRKHNTTPTVVNS